MGRRKVERPASALIRHEPRGTDPEQIEPVATPEISPQQLLAYASIKRLAAELDRPAKALLALAPNNDPFSLVPWRQAGAEWFADLWKRFGGPGAHIRRIHYKIISQKKSIRMPDGRVYQNTRRCWEDLIRASGDARYLDLVRAEDFVDRRNDDPLIHLSNHSGSGSTRVLCGRPQVEAAEMPNMPHLHLERPIILQRYHIELWCEKSTMNDILEPLAREYGCNIVTGSGELSQTACVNVVERAEESGRPVRILYISDFDASGMSMPVSVSRKIEHRLYLKRLRHLDIQLRPIVLTEEQCHEYGLPRKPLKDDPRSDAFEQRFGKGATELDALEANHPGELRRIIETEIARYYDDDLDSAVNHTASEIEDSFEEITRKVHSAHKAEIKILESEWEKIAKEHARLIAQWQKRADPTLHISKDLREKAPDLGLFDWPEPADGDEDDNPLFDSTRDYVEQIDRYKEHQGKPTGRAGVTP